MSLSRRGLFRGIVGVLAAPAIVKAGLLMPVRPLFFPPKHKILSIQEITRLAVRDWKNSNAFLQHIDRQYDAQFATSLPRIGATLRIRLPLDYIATA